MSNVSAITPIDSLLGRRSLAGAFLAAPAPDAAQLRQILGAAQRAADHGRLRPWRFWVVHPEHYEVFFDRLAEAATRQQGDPSRYSLNRDKYRLTAKAPLMVVVGAQVDVQHKVPVVEQGFAAAGAAQLVLNAAHALGFGAFLFSGAGVFDPEFKASFGLGDADSLLGVICIGTPAGPGKPGPSAAQAVEDGLRDTVRTWQPD